MRYMEWWSMLQWFVSQYSGASPTADVLEYGRIMDCLLRDLKQNPIEQYYILEG